MLNVDLIPLLKVQKIPFMFVRIIKNNIFLVKQKTMFIDGRMSKFIALNMPLFY